MTGDVASAVGIAAGALCGAAVGVERQWSGHASGPAARFGGVRTFTLLGGLAGAAGRLAMEGHEGLAALVVLAAAALIVAGYVAASQKEVDATTEVAALVVLPAGLFAGMGHHALASGMTAITILLLVEKRRLHAWVSLIGDAEIAAGARFAVMALVVLPLLPDGSYGPLGGIRPRALWALVLLFSGLSFAGTVMRRLVGGARGYTIAGAIGGLISSTGITLNFARVSRGESRSAAALSSGVTAAAAVMIARVLLLSTVLNPALGLATLPLLGPALVVATLLASLGMRGGVPKAEEIAMPSNPLELRAALQTAVLFQAALSLVHVARTFLGATGVLVSATVLGLTDVDGIVIAMARPPAEGIATDLAAQSLATAVLSNTVFKLAVSVGLGAGRFRTLAAARLGGIAVACAAPLAVALLG